MGWRWFRGISSLPPADNEGSECSDLPNYTVFLDLCSGVDPAGLDSRVRIAKERGLVRFDQGC